MKDKQHRVGRRTFLAGAGVVAAAAGATAMTARTPVASSAVAALPEPTNTDSKGYRVSEHVRKYYRTTLV